MNTDRIEKFKNWFSAYVSGFYTDNAEDNDAMTVKREHTQRVCRNILLIGGRLNLSENDLLLSEAMALFHDIGRFKQYAIYKTFSDRASENHAKLSVKELSRHRMLAECDRDEKRIIAKAVAFHNRLSVPEFLDRRSQFFTRLLRDADKLDIWKVMIEFYKQSSSNHRNRVVALGLPNLPTYSRPIIRSIMKGEIAKIQEMKTVNDFKLLQLSWVFDLNFKPSFEEVRKRRFVEDLASLLPANDEIGAAVAAADRFVERQIY